MARNRLPTARTPLTYGSWVSHYLPVWTAVFLIVMPILFTNVVRSPDSADAAGAKWMADVCLGMLSFWLWALVTNAHEGRLVRSSGRRAARHARQRREELAVILLPLGMTMTFFLLCNLNISTWAKCIFALSSLVLPGIVLGTPQP